MPRLLDRLRARPAAASVFLHGEEEYLRDRAAEAVVDLVLDPATRDFNLDQLRGADTSAEALASVLATPPMMADYRVVVVRDAQGLAPKAREAVETAVARPSPGVVLVLVATIPAGSKAKFYDTLRSAALSVEFPAVDAGDLPGWLIEHAREAHGVEMEVDAARALAAAIGSQLGVLATELAKAAAYVGDRKQIVLDDIRAVGGYIPRVDRWGWLDRIGERRYTDALADLPDLLAAGESAVALVIAMGTHLLKLGMLVDGGREGLERNVRGNQRWLVNRLQPQARQWTMPAIDAALHELLRTDRLLKSASLNDRQALEELILRLAIAAPDALPTPTSVPAGPASRG